MVESDEAFRLDEADDKTSSATESISQEMLAQALKIFQESKASRKQKSNDDLITDDLHRFA